MRLFGFLPGADLYSFGPDRDGVMQDRLSFLFRNESRVEDE